MLVIFIQNFQSLVENTVNSAASLFPTPDLILWTGDNVPHVDDYSIDCKLFELVEPNKFWVMCLDLIDQIVAVNILTA